MSDPKIETTDPNFCVAKFFVDPDAPRSKIKEAKDKQDLCVMGYEVGDTVYIDVTTQNGMKIAHVPARITGSIHKDPGHPWDVIRIGLEIARGAQGTIADDGSIFSRKEGEVYTILAGAGTYLAQPEQMRNFADMWGVSPLQVRQ